MGGTWTLIRPGASWAPHQAPRAPLGRWISGVLAALPAARFTGAALLPPVLGPSLGGPPCCSAAKFNGVHSLDLHFPSNHGADRTTITFIGLRGEFSERRREAVEAVYEVKPMPQARRAQLADSYAPDRKLYHKTALR